MCKLGPVHARDNSPEESRAEPELIASTGTYCTPEQEQGIADPIEIGQELMHTRLEKQEGYG